MKQKYKIYEVAAIVLTCFCFTQSHPTEANKPQNTHISPKLKLPSRSSLLSLLSIITSFEKNPEETIKDHLGNNYSLADVLATNQKLSQDFKISTNLNNTATIIPTLADVTNVIPNVTTNFRDGSVLRSNDSAVINSTIASSSLAPNTTGSSSLQTEDGASSANNEPTITIKTKKPVSLSAAEMQQIIDITNNRRQAGVDSDNDGDLAAETAMEMMVKNKLDVEDAMKVMAETNFEPVDATLGIMAENAAAKYMPTNEYGVEAAGQFMGGDGLGKDANMMARNAPENAMGGNNLGNVDAIQMMDSDAAVRLLAENNLGNPAAMQMVANEVADKKLAQNNFNAKGTRQKSRFRVDDVDIKLMEDDTKDNLDPNALMQMMGRAMPAATTDALSLNFDDSDALHKLNDSISASGNIWQTYETAEATTRGGRKCFQCHPEIKTSFRDPRIPWICGGYNRARRSFKSACIMHMRNCQDGTMFVKLHDNKCPDDKPDELIPHGKTFFYDYEAPVSFESGNEAFADSVPSEVENVEIQQMYDDFGFFGRGGTVKKDTNKQR